MIRPFDLRDVPLVTRLENSGTPLYNELALTHGLHPLRSALAGYFSLHRHGMYTQVACGEPDEEGFVQMQARGEHGVMTYLAPLLSSLPGSPPDNFKTACDLLRETAVVARNIGLQQLIAEAPGDSTEVSILRQAGFAVYVRQDILRLAQDASHPEPPTASSLLREAKSVDAWAIQQLYYNTTPRLAQLAGFVPQVKPSGTVRGYVLEEDADLMAHLEIRQGSVGAWFNVMIHPQAEAQAQQVLEHGLALLGKQRNEPIYCCVRRYQEWLWKPLLALGFESFMSSAVLVRRLAVPVTEPELMPVAALEASAKITSPVARAVTNDE